MTEETRLQELLSQWQERRRQGQEPAVDELCRDCPDLAPVLRQRVDALRQIGDFVQQMDETSEGPRPATPETLQASTTISAPLPQLPGYEILQELGRGGMGIVYLARHIKLNRLVALKRVHLSPHVAAQGGQDRFRTEAEAAARLQHPNIVQVYDILDSDGWGCRNTKSKPTTRCRTRSRQKKFIAWKCSCNFPGTGP